ncbi:hypothetical protein [Actinomadura sp. HBU206391]|uniref:hypothetical protein n=1 Tax=Actinomadura sp. HBU206391 TaxID=2731692 RepID=UPI00164F2B19|nr:hypothetical protein [Actinomadura sp. HBU206391]MBC6463139.1 hypothetical protein [Actinomadura sp. HBU206391]
MSDRREEALARALADEVGADPDDISPWIVAAQINAVQHRLMAEISKRKVAGPDPRRDVRRRAGRRRARLRPPRGGHRRLRHPGGVTRHAADVRVAD